MTRILIAEDEPVSRDMLESTLRSWNYEVIVTENGADAWRVLERDDAPDLAVIDWMMPGIDGIELCRRVRNLSRFSQPYIIILTARITREDIVTGLDAGANDVVTKPFDRAELRARLRVGVRCVEMHRTAAERVRKLEEALANVKQLQSLLPICSYCKKIRNDRNYWEQVENYLTDHVEVQFTHGICPDCFERISRPIIEGVRPVSGMVP